MLRQRGDLCLACGDRVNAAVRDWLDAPAPADELKRTVSAPTADNDSGILAPDLDARAE